MTFEVQSAVILTSHADHRMSSLPPLLPCFPANVAEFSALPAFPVGVLHRRSTWCGAVLKSRATNVKEAEKERM